MLIPTTMHQLNVAHTAFGHAPREQTVAGEPTIDPAVVDAVQVERLAGFPSDIGQFRHTGLHPKRHFVLGDAGIDFGIADLRQRQLIQFCDTVEHFAASSGVDAGRVRQVQHRVISRAKTHSLMLRGNKAAAPQSRENRLVGLVAAALRDHHDEVRQVRVFAAETIAQPRAQAGAPRLLAAGLQEGNGRIVVDGFGVHRFDESDVIDDGGRLREQFAEPRPRLTMLLKIEDRRGAGERLLPGGHAGDTLPHADRIGEFGAVQFLQLRLVIEQVDVRWPTRHDQPDDPFSLGPKVQRR